MSGICAKGSRLMTRSSVDAREIFAGFLQASLSLNKKMTRQSPSCGLGFPWTAATRGTLSCSARGGAA